MLLNEEMFHLFKLGFFRKKINKFFSVRMLTQFEIGFKISIGSKFESADSTTKIRSITIFESGLLSQVQRHFIYSG